MKVRGRGVQQIILGVVLVLLVSVDVYGQELGIDRPGSNYRSFDLPKADPALCKKACDDDPQCKAYTYVKLGVQGPNARCWLKSAIPAAVKNDYCISGVKEPKPDTLSRKSPEATKQTSTIEKDKNAGRIAGAVQAPVTQSVSGIRENIIAPTSRLGFEVGFNRPGSDYRDFEMLDPNPDACRIACVNDLKCSAFTFVRGGLAPAPRAHCWLKSSAPAPVKDVRFVSGIVHHTATLAKSKSIQPTVEKRVWAVNEKKGPPSPEAQQKSIRMNSQLQQWKNVVQRQFSELNINLHQRQQQAFRQIVMQSKTLFGDEQKVLAIAANPEMRASLINGVKISESNQLTATLAKPPQVDQVLSLSSAQPPGTVDEGGYLFINGRNFGAKRGVLRLVYQAIKEFAPQQNYTIDLLPLFDTWEDSWSDTLIAARVPYFNISEGYALTNQSPHKLVVSLGPGKYASSETPVRLERRGIGFTTVIPTPAWADGEHINAIVPGGTILVQGNEFGNDQDALEDSRDNRKVWLELSDSGKIINLRIVKWSDRQVLLEVPDSKEYQGDYPFQSARFWVQNDRMQQAMEGVWFGPRMEIAVVSGEQFLELSKKDDEDRAITEGTIMTVIHDPGCALVFGKGNEGLDVFFNEGPRGLPRNSRVVQSFVVWQHDPDELEKTLKFLFDELVDWCTKNFWYKFAEYGIAAIGLAFDPNVGSYYAKVERAPTPNAPERFNVHWANTCYSLSPMNGVPVVYTASFAVWAPAGTIQR